MCVHACAYECRCPRHLGRPLDLLELKVEATVKYGCWELSRGSVPS